MRLFKRLAFGRTFLFLALMVKNLLISALLITILSSCRYLNKDNWSWKKEYYQEKCILSNYHAKWEDKNCSFRLVKVDPNATRHPLKQ